MASPVVVRFAPSPTGPLHIGGVRTALYNYLFARQQGGRFLLRIEDTDQQRYVPGAEAYIMDSLEWLGIRPDEGVREGGPRGPYRQSDRAREGIYRRYAQQLIESGHAYYAFDTPEALDAMRQELQRAGSDVQQYNYLTRGRMQNSFTLPEAEVQRRIAAGEPHVVRMNMPADTEIRFFDLIRQEVVFHTRQLDDKVLVKSDGLPTYHLANVVDDRLMEVTHVIRGEEWVSSTPLHVVLYQALGWAEHMPQFVHLPLILNPNGQGKLSKRHGDQMGFPVFPLDWTDPESGSSSAGFRERGYLPDALLNFLALLGWSPGHDEELMSLGRMTELFSLDRLGNAGAKFDLNKLNWFNEQYLRSQPAEAWLPGLRAAAEAAGLPIPADAYLGTAVELMRERVSFIHQIVQDAPFLFRAPESYDPQMQAKAWKPETASLLAGFADRLAVHPDWDAHSLHEAFQAYLAEVQAGAGKVMAPLRLALTGVPNGPGVFDMAALFGREETLARIRKAIETLG
ncbi:MAG: glutamate--tRNA ligase [Bacteroidia bacterium]|nr:glutamate--tRNA ligase [Bacteroidia bacterium]